MVAGPGAKVAAGDPVVIMESMKMEIPVEAPADGTITEILVAEGDPARQDDPVAVLETNCPPPWRRASNGRKVRHRPVPHRVSR